MKAKEELKREKVICGMCKVFYPVKDGYLCTHDNLGGSEGLMYSKEYIESSGHYKSGQVSDEGWEKICKMVKEYNRRRLIYLAAPPMRSLFKDIIGSQC